MPPSRVCRGRRGAGHEGGAECDAGAGRDHPARHAPARPKHASKVRHLSSCVLPLKIKFLTVLLAYSYVLNWGTFSLGKTTWALLLFRNDGERKEEEKDKATATSTCLLFLCPARSGILLALSLIICTEHH